VVVVLLLHPWIVIVMGLLSSFGGLPPFNFLENDAATGDDYTGAMKETSTGLGWEALAATMVEAQKKSLSGQGSIW
jgi:hypothetical protein